jgi:ATP-dependent protease ClpP protease subunit
MTAGEARDWGLIDRVIGTRDEAATADAAPIET